MSKVETRKDPVLLDPTSLGTSRLVSALEKNRNLYSIEIKDQMCQEKEVQEFDDSKSK